MSRTRKKYSNGQSRGKGTMPQKHASFEKDYHLQEVLFHGGEMAYNRWAESGKKGYNTKKD